MALIIYASKEKLTPDHHSVNYAVRRGGNLPDGRVLYVRVQHVELADDEDLSDGLLKARPLKVGEVQVENVLNCVPDGVVR